LKVEKILVFSQLRAVVFGYIPVSFSSHRVVSCIVVTIDLAEGTLISLSTA